jgi:thioredoxin reductase (NADPH)
MADDDLPDASELPEAATVTLGEAERAELAPFGVERDIAVGDVLYRAGDAEYDFIVIIEGAVEIIRSEPQGDVRVALHTAGRFVGELNMLTGQRAYLTARVTQPGRILAIPHDAFRRMMSTKPQLSDVIFGAFIARRQFLRAGEGAGAVRIIGSRYSPEAMALRAFANRTRLPHTWIDLEEAADAAGLLASLGAGADDAPVVQLPWEILRRPTPGEFAERLGLTFHPVPGYLCDLVVVGTGPAGLAAAVYGASEGLDTISLDAVALGGQAGSSSRIENYVGFPNGISGEDLAARAAIQAQRLGARLNAPCEVAGLRVEHGFHVIVLADGSELPSRAVIVASGARYRRLAVPGLEQFEGAGVYYAATDLEARVCGGFDVTVVGGGNSAGQAAIYMSQQKCSVRLVVRRDSLVDTMSHYLIERVEADPRIEVVTQTEVRALAGEEHLKEVTLEHTPTGERRTVECSGLFCFIGAEPATQWLSDCVKLDRAGFVLTDRSLPETVRTGADFTTRAPLPFETSLPGVFAVGDVRQGSLKRVAAAVGEGSSAVRSVHEYLATTTA